MEVKYTGAIITLIVLLSQVSAQEGTDPPIASIPFGGKCQYSPECTSMALAICKYDPSKRESFCDCEDYYLPTDDQRECIKDIGAPCERPEDCYFQFKYTNSRTCIDRKCTCTGFDDCGGGHSVQTTSEDYYTNEVNTRPTVPHDATTPRANAGSTPRANAGSTLRTNAGSTLRTNVASTTKPILSAGAFGSGKVNNKGSMLIASWTVIFLLPACIRKLIN